MEVSSPQPEEQPHLEALLRWAFDVPEDGARRWVERGGLEHWRVARRHGEPVACLLAAPAGHFFGGRSVPCRAICAVTTAPEARGEGIANQLLAATVQELAREGVAVASLFPSTRALYRSAGFEPAGTHHRYRVPLHTLDGLRNGSRQVRPLCPSDEREVLAIYVTQAEHWNGPLDRSAYFWSRVRETRGHEVRGFGLHSGGALEAYIYLHTQRLAAGDPRYALEIKDLAWRTPDAARALLSFLARHGTLAAHASWGGGPADPLVQLLPEVGYSAEMSLGHWMLRIVDLPRAFEARGYPAGVDTTLELEVTDGLVPSNAGRFMVKVREGRATVRRGGKGRLRLDVRPLAPLFTGLLPPASLRDLGLLEANDAAVRAATAALAGPTPWVREAW